VDIAASLPAFDVVFDCIQQVQRWTRGLRLLQLRRERLERPFAHLYETDGTRRVYLRGRTNISSDY
jgi:hypothetical protein